MDKNELENENYWKSSDFIVDRYSDSEERKEMDQIYNLSFFRNEIIQGILSTEGNLASVDDVRILTTGSFKNLEFQARLREQDIEEVWAMNKAFKYLEENIDKPLTLEIIKNYNSLIVTGLKGKYSGDLRQTNVFINNTVYSPPDFRGLERLVDNGLKEIEMLDGNINKAFSYLLMISKLQVFIDGNKRTALLSAIHHLAYTKQPLLMFFSDFTQEYLKSLKHFYETGDNEAVSNVLYKQLDINR